MAELVRRMHMLIEPRHAEARLSKGLWLTKAKLWWLASHHMGPKGVHTHFTDVKVLIRPGFCHYGYFNDYFVGECIVTHLRSDLLA